MATAVQTVERENYLNSNYGIKSWLLTTDHKRIALLYLVSITAMFWIGGFFAMLIRLKLLTPAGDLVTSDTYNKLFTMHGIIMVFFFLIPSVPAVIGNFVIPLMVGAKDLAFPRVNLLSWYIYMLGAITALTAMVTGGVDTGWTFYTPFSTTYSNTHVIGAAIGIFITGFSSILTGLNFIVTIHRMRAPGLTWRRLPLFCWSNYAAALIMVLGTPVIAITLLLVALERAFNIGVFNPQLGGDPSALPAPVLVLFAPGGLHHDPAGHGRDQRDCYLLLAQARLRLRVRGAGIDRHCGSRFPGLGTPHVRCRHLGVCGAGVFAAQLSGRDSVRGEGL